MDSAFDIADPTDWLDTPLSRLSSLENALHCQVCKEFYETPMITSCSHTFCSKCIRTCLSTDGKCPACRAADQASKLRNNWALQEVVATFQAARPAALEVARREREVAEQANRPGKRKRIVLDSDDVADMRQDGRTTRSKSRRVAASQRSQTDVIEVEDSDADGDGEYVEDPADDGLVECPLGCGKRMKIEMVEPHLDRCEEEKQQASRAKSRTPVLQLGTSRNPPATNHAPQERLAELNYSLFNETKLGRKLKEIGIPSSGSKQLMIRRHTEWVNLWNANCDSSHSRSKRELLQDLDTWERTQGGKAPNVNGTAASVMKKDFDGVGWASKNKDEFSRLIADAQRKKPNPVDEETRPKDAGAGENADGIVNDLDGSAGLPYDLEPSSDRREHVETPPLASLRPYENSSKALASIRAKVEATNPAQYVEPTLHAGHKSMDSEHEGSKDEHMVNGTMRSICDLPGPLDSTAKKLPMFAVPEQPVSNVDGGNRGTAAH